MAQHSSSRRHYTPDVMRQVREGTGPEQETVTD